MRQDVRQVATIREVAARAGVSVATASRALSSRGYVSPETKQRIHDAAQDLGYKLHASARSLKLRRTDTVGLMVADIVNPFYSYLADGVLACSKRLGYHVILCVTGEDPAQEAEYLQVLMEQRVDGIIAVATGHNLRLWQDVLELGTRLVLVDRELPGITDADVVLIDNVQGAYDATTHLIELGHRRIAIINGPTSTTTGQGRLQGFYDAHAAAQLPVYPELVEIGSFKREHGLEAARKLLALANRPTALFATNNVLAETTLFTLRERGLRIPDDISLVIFDDVPWASLTSPRISAVAQPMYDLGCLSMERLSQHLPNIEPVRRPPQRTVLRAGLIVRESSAACPK